MQPRVNQVTTAPPPRWYSTRARNSAEQCTPSSLTEKYTLTGLGDDALRATHIQPSLLQRLRRQPPATPVISFPEAGRVFQDGKVLVNGDGIRLTDQSSFQEELEGIKAESDQCIDSLPDITALKTTDVPTLKHYFSGIQAFNNKLKVMGLFLQIALLQIKTTGDSDSDDLEKIKTLSNTINEQMEKQIVKQVEIMKVLQDKSNGKSHEDAQERRLAMRALEYCADQDYQPHSHTQLLQYELAAVWGRQALSMENNTPSSDVTLPRAIFQLRFLAGNIYHQLELRREKGEVDRLSAEQFEEGLGKVTKGQIEQGTEARLEYELESTIGDGSPIKKKELFAYTANPVNGGTPIHMISLRPSPDGGYAVSHTITISVDVDWKVGFVCSGRRKAYPETPANHMKQTTDDLYQKTTDTVFRWGSVSTEVAAMKGIMAALRHAQKFEGDPKLLIANLLSVGNPKDAKMAAAHRQSVHAALDTLKSWINGLVQGIDGTRDEVLNAIVDKDDPLRPIFDEVIWRCGHKDAPEGEATAPQSTGWWLGLYQTLGAAVTQTGVNSVAKLGRRRELSVNNLELQKVGRVAINHLTWLERELMTAKADWKLAFENYSIYKTSENREAQHKARKHYNTLQRDAMALINALFLLNRTWKTNGFLNPKRSKSDVELPALMLAVTVLSRRSATAIFGCMSNKDRASVVNAAMRSYVNSARDQAVKRIKDSLPLHITADQIGTGPVEEYFAQALKWAKHFGKAYLITEGQPAAQQQVFRNSILAPKSVQSRVPRARVLSGATGIRAEFWRAISSVREGVYDDALVPTNQFPRIAGTEQPDLLMMDQENEVPKEEAYDLFIKETDIGILEQNLKDYKARYQMHAAFYGNMLEASYEQFPIQAKNVGIGGAKYRSGNWEILSGLGREWILMYKAGQRRLRALQSEAEPDGKPLHRKSLPKEDRFWDRIDRGGSPSLRSVELVFQSTLLARKRFILGGSGKVPA